MMNEAVQRTRDSRRDSFCCPWCLRRASQPRRRRSSHRSPHELISYVVSMARIEPITTCFPMISTFELTPKRNSSAEWKTMKTGMKKEEFEVDTDEYYIQIVKN